MARSDVEDIYPLSPMQDGMLFHGLLEPESGLYVEQFSWEVAGAFDAEAFARAWQAMVDRHPVLRTGFFWENVERPLQVVRRSAQLPCRQLDWSEVPVEQQRQRLDALMAELHATGFDLRRPPLLRLTTVRLGADRHRVVWDFHHLLLDGWSMPLVLDEVLAGYRADTDGTQATLVDRRPYADYIAWLAEQPLADAQAYWRDQLDGITSPTPLGVDRAQPGAGHGERRRDLSSAVAADLRGLARALRVTASTVLAAAWGLLLGHYSGRDDVVFGTTVSGRPASLPGSDAMIGLFINTVPVRVRVPPAHAVSDWLEGLQEARAAGADAEFARLVDVQAWSDVPRGVELFESLLVYENYPAADAAGDDAPFVIRDVEAVELTNYPLTLVAQPGGGGLALRALFDRSRFDDATVDRLLDHLAQVVRGIVADPDQLVGDVEVIGAEEAERVRRWATGPRLAVPDATTPELVAAAAGTDPEAEAVVGAAASAVAARDAEVVAGAGTALTYGALHARALAGAGRLRDRGVGPGDRVALAVGRSQEWVIAQLATWYAGAAFVALDPAVPADRLRALLDDCHPAVTLTDAELAGLCAPDGEMLEQPIPVAADDVAYVIYTSGSTGAPKGVEVTHRGLANLVAWHRDTYRPSPGERASSLAGLGFDASVWETWPTLAAGATLCLAPAGVAADVDALLGWLDAQTVAVAFLPTPVAEAALATDRWPSSLRLLLTGGDRLRRRPPPGLHFTLHNHYGPTEASVVATAALVEPDGTAPPAIGRPLPNTAAYVLDPRGALAAEGVVGELHLGGSGLARGYLGRPDLTAERFRDHPCYGRLYATGDLVRWGPDGALGYVGRADDQVQIRGVRVEPAEIETALAGAPGVTDAAVAMRDGRLVAYIVGTTEDRACQAHLAARLPASHLPTAYVPLPALPLTGNGKVDRAALPAPERPRLVQPRNRAEAAVAAAWSEVLGVTDVGVHDNFFALGGHSLLATQLVSRIRSRLETDLPLRALFDAPTIAQLAARLPARPSAAALADTQPPDRPSADVPAPPPASRRPAAPSPWLVVPEPRPAARARLFCLPYAGGGASTYRPWARLVPPTIELVAVQLPGREDRRRDDALRRMPELVAAAVTALDDRFDRPFALFGHSMGALIAFELARELRRSGRREPVHLFASGHGAPQLPSRSARAYDAPDEAFAERLRELEGTPEEVLAHPELRALLLPLIRADFELCDTYTYTREPPLDVPISAFGGVADEVVSREQLAAWEEQTIAGFALRMLPGGHFFLRDQDDVILRTVAADLLAAARTG